MSEDRDFNLFMEMGFHPLQRQGIILLPKSEVLPCSEELLKRRARILGYDGFVFHPDGSLQPSLNNIADYSAEQPQFEIIGSFLEGLGEDITHLEIVVQL